MAKQAAAFYLVTWSQNQILFRSVQKPEQHNPKKVCQVFTFHMLFYCLSERSQFVSDLKGVSAERMKGVGQADELGRASESCEAHVLFISRLRPVLKLQASGLWLWIMADRHVAESTLTSSNSRRSYASLPVLVPRCRQYAPKAKFANKSLEFTLTPDDMLVCLRWAMSQSNVFKMLKIAFHLTSLAQPLWRSTVPKNFFLTTMWSSS